MSQQTLNIDALAQNFNQSEAPDERLEELQGRVKRCCCSYCGSELVLRRITTGREDNGRTEIFCPNCNRIEFGCEKEIYRAGLYYVNALKFDYYPDLDDSERKRRMNCAKACEIIQWGCKNLGLLTADGFSSPLNIDASLIGEDLTFTPKHLN